MNNEEPAWSRVHATELTNHWWWRPGWKVGTRYYAWHITFDDQAGFHSLVDRYQEQLAHVDGLDLIPREWLHLTIQGLGFVEDVSVSQVDDVLANVGERFSELNPVTVRFEKPIIRPEAIALIPRPFELVQDLQRQIREAIADVLGQDAVPAEPATGFQPHVSIAYVNTPQPADAVVQALSRAEAQAVSVDLPQVALIEMHRDRRMYEWETVATVDVGQRAFTPPR